MLIGKIYIVKCFAGDEKVFEETFPFLNKPSDDDIRSFIRLIRPIMYKTLTLIQTFKTEFEYDYES